MTALEVVLRLPKLKFLDLRFKEYERIEPRGLFDEDLDAIFINNNQFVFDLPNNFRIKQCQLFCGVLLCWMKWWPRQMQIFGVKLIGKLHENLRLIQGKRKP